MGLTEQTIFDTDVALPYWQQYPVSEFITVIVSEIRQDSLVVKGWLQIIHDIAVAGGSEVPIADKRITISEACEIALQRGASTQRKLNLALAYARAYGSTKPNRLDNTE
jgi:hypothetical protein